MLDPEVLDESVAGTDSASTLPVTGSALWPLFLAAVLIDLGYLARSAASPGAQARRAG